MSRTLRIVLLAGCGLLGALHLPAATRTLADGIDSSARAVRAMERSSTSAPALEPEDEGPLQERVARRD